MRCFTRLGFQRRYPWLHQGSCSVPWTSTAKKIHLNKLAVHFTPGYCHCMSPPCCQQLSTKKSEVAFECQIRPLPGCLDFLRYWATVILQLFVSRLWRHKFWNLSLFCMPFSSLPKKIYLKSDMVYKAFFVLLLSNKLYRIGGKLVLTSCFATLPVIISSYFSCRIKEARKVMIVWAYALSSMFRPTIYFGVVIYFYSFDNNALLRSLLWRPENASPSINMKQSGRRGEETYHLHLSINSICPKILRNLFKFKHLIRLLWIFSCDLSKHFGM